MKVLLSLNHQVSASSWIFPWSWVFLHVFSYIPVDIFKWYIQEQYLRRIFFLKILFIHLQREGKGERRKGEGGEKERETSMCERNIHRLPLAHNWGPGRQPSHVPWQKIDLRTFWFAGQCSIHWVTPARAREIILNNIQPENIFLLPSSMMAQFGFSLRFCSSMCFSLQVTTHSP